MKKFTLLFALLLSCVGAVKAQTVPRLTTNENAPVLYTIASYDREGFLTYSDGLYHIDKTVSSYWYFTAASGNSAGTAAAGVIMHNVGTGQCLTTGMSMDANGGTWYILPNGVNTEGLSISTASSISNANNCIDANNTNTGTGWWHPSSGDWQGTTWVFSEANYADVVTSAKSSYVAEATALKNAAIYSCSETAYNTCISALNAAATGDFTAYSSVTSAINSMQTAMDNLYATDRENALTVGTSVRFVNRSRTGRYLCSNAEATNAYSTTDNTTLSTVWTLKTAEGGFKLYNEYVNKYIAELPGQNNNQVELTDESNAGVYTINPTSTYVYIKQVSGTPEENRDVLHCESWYGNIVRWEKGAEASHWTVTEVTAADLAALHNAAKTALSAALTAANNAATTYEGYIGTGVGQYTVHSAETIAAAQTVYDAASSTAYQMDQATASLTPAVVMNMPATGKFYRFKSNNKNRYITVPASGNTGTAMEMDGTASIANVMYLPGANKILCYKSGFYMNNKNHAHMGYSGTYYIAASKKSSPTLGTYSIAQGSATGSCLADHENGQTAIDQYGDGNYAGAEWIIEELTELPVAVGAAGLATLYAPVALTVPAGVKAYIGTLSGDVINLTKVTTIPANTGVIVQAAEGTYNFPITTTEETATSCFVGTLPTISTVTNSYTLQEVGGELGFYPYSGGNLSGFKAYYVGGSGAEGLSLNFGNVTAIESVLAPAAGKAEIFDLSGRRVQKAGKGLYIVGGKKVFIK